MWAYSFLFQPTSYTLLLPLFIAMFPLSQICPLQDGPYFDMLPSVFEHFLTFCHKCSKFILYSLESTVSPKKGALFWRCICCRNSFQSWDSFQMCVAEPKSGDFRCKILFRIFIWFFFSLDWIWSNLPKNFIRLNLWNNFQGWIRGGKQIC